MKRTRFNLPAYAFAMKILLQSFETGLYLDLIGSWTNDPALARDFPDTLQATEFKLQRRLSQAFVVLVPEPVEEVRLPSLRAEPGPREKSPATARSVRDRQVYSHSPRKVVQAP